MLMGNSTWTLSTYIAPAKNGGDKPTRPIRIDSGITSWVNWAFLIHRVEMILEIGKSILDVNGLYAFSVCFVLMPIEY